MSSNISSLSKKTARQQTAESVVCKNGSHPLFRCLTFTNGTVNQRWKWIKQHKYCANCLRFTHTVNSCASAQMQIV